MAVGVLISIMISIVIGVTLIPALTDSIKEVQEGEELTEAASAMLDILPLVFVAVIILGAVAWIGGSVAGGDGDSVSVKIHKNGRKLVIRLRRSSEGVSEYVNNLDRVLGVTIVEASTEGRKALYLSKEEGLLYTSPEFDWFLVDKNPDAVMFKVVGLHREDRTRNEVYIIGSNEKGPYVYSLPATNTEEDLQREWIKLVRAGV